MMNFKDEKPLQFEIMQSDLEKVMAELPEGPVKYNLQGFINYFIKTKDWK